MSFVVGGSNYVVGFIWVQEMEQQARLSKNMERKLRRLQV